MPPTCHRMIVIKRAMLGGDYEQEWDVNLIFLDAIFKFNPSNGELVIGFQPFFHFKVISWVSIFTDAPTSPAAQNTSEVFVTLTTSHVTSYKAHVLFKIKENLLHNK